MAVPQDDMDKIDESTARFFITRTKAEIMDAAVNRGIMMYPVSTTADMLENPQLAARNFWVDVEHPELGTTIKYPGAFGLCSETPPVISRRAPLIGEHNLEIYQDELGFSGEQLTELKQAGVI
jgi:crotonobetainyl-CoA:carnitine CoA-transferase CaiB-like acyl-CoA transferase